MARSFDGGNRRLTCAWGVLIAAAWLVGSGCSSNDSASMAESSNGDGSIYNPSYGSGGALSNGVGSGATYSTTTSTGVTAPPAEVEVKVDFEAPQSSQNYVYATNPTRDSVAVISAASLAIEVVETGDEPRYLRTIPFKDAALLIDVASSDIAYIETANAKSSITYFQKLPSANAIKVAPDGKHAVAYYDVDAIKASTFETLQDVTVMTFGAAGPVATKMTTGFKARDVTFAGDASGSPAAYVVTEDGISVLDFAAIDASKKAGIAQPTLGRVDGTSKLRLVDLATGKPATLDLASLFPPPTPPVTAVGGANGVAGSNGAAGAAGAAGGLSATGGSATVAPVATAEITDLDVAPNGKFALAVARDKSTLLRLPIPEAFSDPSVITKLPVSGVVVGSAALSPNGNWAVLYTTAVTSERRIVIVDLVGDASPRILDLTKIIKGVAFSASGNQAYVAHKRPDTISNSSTLTTEQIIDQAYGYSLVDLPKAFRKLQITPADTAFSVTVPNSPYVFLTLSDTNNTVQRLDMDSLQVDSLELGSKPISLGVVPSAQRAFVSQEYAEGRLTFIDWNTLETTTVTGYELNSKIRE